MLLLREWGKVFFTKSWYVIVIYVYIFLVYSNNEVQINMKYEVAIIGIKSPSFFSYYTFFKDLLFVPKILESFGILGNLLSAL